jgi:hypothetical protein
MTNSITLTDTGKLYYGATLNTNELRARGTDGSTGTALTIYGTDFTIQYNTTTRDDTTTQNKRGDATDTNYDYREWVAGDVDQTGIEQPTYTFDCVFNFRNLDDGKAFGRLLMMCKTKGYKELGTGTIATTTGIPLDYTLPALAYSKYDHPSIDSANNDSPTYHTVITSLPVRIKSLKAKNSAKDGNLVTYTLELVEIGKPKTY